MSQVGAETFLRAGALLALGLLLYLLERLSTRQEGTARPTG